MITDDYTHVSMWSDVSLLLQKALLWAEPRFLPLNDDIAASGAPWLIRLYLALKPMAGQMLVVARRD